MASDINNLRPAYLIQPVRVGLNKHRKAVNGAHILELLAYKKDANDAPETPATDAVRGLVDLSGDVDVPAEPAGPHETDTVAPRVALTVKALTKSDAVVLMTGHEDADYGLVVRHAPYVFDTRHRLKGDQIETL